jgi:CHAT domain-containing protein
LNEVDSLTRDTFDRWQGCRRSLAEEYALPIKERKGVAEMDAEAERYEKALTLKLNLFNDALYAPCWQDVRDSLKVGEAAIEFISFPYYAGKGFMSVISDDTLYAAFVLFPRDTAPHFIPLFEERQLQALLNCPGLEEELVLKDLYGKHPDLRQLLWDPLEPLLHDAKTIYYSPAGLLHRINPAALQDESKQTLSEGRQWVRVGSTRELVTHNLADKSFARISAEVDSISGNPPSAIIYGGITYDMDSLAYTAANPTEHLDSTGYYLPKDGNFRYIVTEPSKTKMRGSRNLDGTWTPLDSTAREADEINVLLQGAGFRTEVQKSFYASEERFKQIGVRAPSPRILHIATHGFSYPDPKKEPPKGFGNTEPAYKLLDDPMLRSGLVLAGANFYCKNERPLKNAEDGMPVAYEVRDLNLQNTELAVLSACQTGRGYIQGSEGVYGLQRAFRIAGAKFLIVSLWDVPDKQTQELMRLFYQNWLDKKESLRDAFNHAQQALRETEPSPYMWAGFVLIE